jgi:hypothetical protein
MDTVAAGLNRYRAWIDAKEWHLFVACQGLGALVWIAVWALGWGAILGVWWLLAVGLVLAPVIMYLGIGQMTSWRGEP